MLTVDLARLAQSFVLTLGFPITLSRIQPFDRLKLSLCIDISTHEFEIGGLRANSCWVTMVDNPRRIAPGEVERVVLQLTAPHSVGEFRRWVELGTSFGRFQVQIVGTVKPSRIPAAPSRIGPNANRHQYE